MTLHDKHPQGAPIWADLMCDDPERARRFYGALFDWSFDIGAPESGPYTTCKLRGRNVAGIGPKPPGLEMRSAWSVYLGAADLDATLARVREAGGTVLMGPMDVFEHGRMATIADPTGGVVGLWQPRSHRGFQITEEPGSFTWTELNTRDLDAARRFLVALFGYQAHKLEGMEYETLHVGEQTAAGILQMDDTWPTELPPHWMVYFAVADTDAVCQTIRSLGGAIHVPAFDTPYGRMSVVTDPQGAAFTVIQRPAQQP